MFNYVVSERQMWSFQIIVIIIFDTMSFFLKNLYLMVVFIKYLT